MREAAAEVGPIEKIFHVVYKGYRGYWTASSILQTDLYPYMDTPKFPTRQSAQDFIDNHRKELDQF